MSRVITLTSGANSATLQIDDEESVTIMSPVTIYQDDSSISFLVDEMSYSMKLADSINIDGVAFSGTLTQLKTAVQAVMPTSGSPTEVTVYQLKTTLTDAQIKALPTTPVQLVPAPGANKIIIFQSAIFRTPNLVAPYTVSEDDGMNICFDDGMFKQQDASINKSSANGAYDLQALLSASSLEDNMLRDPSRIIANAAFGTLPAFITQDALNASNKSLSLYGYSSNPAWTGGNAANTMEVTVFYSIVDL